MPKEEKAPQVSEAAPAPLVAADVESTKPPSAQDSPAAVGGDGSKGNGKGKGKGKGKDRKRHGKGEGIRMSFGTIKVSVYIYTYIYIIYISTHEPTHVKEYDNMLNQCENA